MGISSAENNGLAVTAYAGDRTVLLAFDLPEDAIDNLAGFAIAVSEPGAAPNRKHPYYLLNRLKFAAGITGSTPYNEKIWTPSDMAPFQSFHWAHYPSLGSGVYTYTVTARYFTGNNPLKSGASVDVTANLQPLQKGTVELGFTRTMISSQAYANKFGNKPLYPTPQSIRPYSPEYLERHGWLGAHAREMVMGFLEKCGNDPGVTLDAFTYDLDESTIIEKIGALGGRARVFQDNHSGRNCPSAPQTAGKTKTQTGKKTKKPLEADAVRALRDGGVAVKIGHFKRQAHNKVLIRRRDGVAEAVLTGSMNFQVRGLYVQANGVLVFENPEVAGLYARAFDEAWAGTPDTFIASPIASKWHDVAIGGHRYSFSFAPHKEPWPLDRIQEAIDGAGRSVLFAMMQMQLSKGVAIASLKALPEREDIYSMGIIQHKGDIGLFKPDTGDKNFTHAAASYLKKNVPAPFSKEISGGSGMVIHHKVVVCDFNGKNPVVFCGSSNLAADGEKENGDNLMAISDPDVAVMYAVELFRQYEHFRFRSRQAEETKTEPLVLRDSDRWARRYFEKGNIYCRERLALMERTI